MRALRAGSLRGSCTNTRQTGPACCAQGLHARGREGKIGENLPAAAPPAPDAASIEVLSWFIIVVVAARGACFQRVHGGELWRLPEARPFLAEVTPPKRHTAHRREGTRGAAQTVQVSTAAQGGGADTSGQQRGAGAWRALPGAFLTILHVGVSFQAVPEKFVRVATGNASALLSG